MTSEEIDSYRYKDGIPPTEYTWSQRKGFLYMHGRVWCMNCHSEAILNEDSDWVFPRENCPNDECYNFARGIDFWLTGQEWLQNPKAPNQSSTGERND